MTSLIEEIFPGTSEMAAKCRAYDWAQTPLGDPECWSHSLKTTVGIVLTSRHPMFLFWGPAHVQLFNDAYSPSLGTGDRHDHALGANGKEFWTDIWSVIGPQIDQVLGTGVATWHENQYLPIERNGKLDDVWWTYSYSPVRDDDGSINGVLVVCQETTERVRSEQRLKDSHEALRVSQEMLRMLQEASPIGFALQSPIRDADGTLTDFRLSYINSSGAAILQSTPGQMIGKEITQLFPGVREEGVFQLYAHLLETGEPMKQVIQYNRDGVDSAFALTGLRVDDAIVVTFVDVSEEQRARAAREELLSIAEDARRDAETANRAKGQFLSTMSHELRTPLNAIGGYVELLDLGIRGPVTDEQRRDLMRIKHSQLHLLGLVNDVLDLAKVDAGNLEIDNAAVHVAGTIEDALLLVRPQAAAKSLEVDDQSSGAHGLFYVGDEDRVRQILVNLLANAVKFTRPNGRVTVRFEVADDHPHSAALTEARRYLAVHVGDNGVGIPAGQMERIFDPFTQADAEAAYTRPSGGAGLGLAISRRLARLMGGDLTAESQPEQGSVFTLWLPLAPQSMTEEWSSSLGRTATFSAAAARPSGEHMAASPQALQVALIQVGSHMLAQAGTIISAWIARLRADLEMPEMRHIGDEQLEDHMTAMLATLAVSVRIADTAHETEAGIQRDGIAILDTLSGRHGAQRARLGWTASSVTRELQLLREVVSGVIRDTPAVPSAARASAIAIVSQQIEHAGRISKAEHQVALQEMDASAKK